jgi:hypothetical protein
MKRDGLERRIGVLEARRPPVKSDTQKILERLDDDELDRVGAIVEKMDRGGKPTPDESAFLDNLEAKYGPAQVIE